MEHENDHYTNCNWLSWYSHQRTGTRTGDHPNDSIVEINQNTEKSPGELSRLAVNQTRKWYMHNSARVLENNT